MKAFLNRRLVLGTLLATVVVSTAGCGGFNGTYSASPATLFIQHRSAPVRIPTVSPAPAVESVQTPGSAETGVVTVD